MSRQRKTLLWMVGVIVLLGIAAIARTPQRIDGQGSVSMLNVGQGDSFLIQAPNGAQLLIDGGKDSKVLTELARVMPTGDTSIDVVIATHPDADHIGGLPLVLDRYKVGLFLTSQVSSDTEIFKDLYSTLDEHDIPSYYVRRGMALALDGSASSPQAATSFKILFPDRDTVGWETNTASVVGRLEVGTASMLLTGDSPISIETYLSKLDPKSIDVDILQIGHHGSKTSTSEVFLRTTTPGLALISAGVNNRYGHPAPEVVDRLKLFGIRSISTQERGTVTVVTDGAKWSVQK